MCAAGPHARPLCSRAEKLLALAMQMSAGFQRRQPPEFREIASTFTFNASLLSPTS